MTEELEVLCEVCRILDGARVPYMITGSIASNFYAVPRMTRDIDLVVEVHREDEDRILKLFQNHFYVDRGSVSEALANQGMFNMIHNRYVVKVDFIVRKAGEYRGVEFGRRRQIEVEGQKIWIVSPEDLILSKLYWAKDSQSEMQLRDVQNLIGTVKNLDTAYLNRWIQTLNLDEIYRRVEK